MASQVEALREEISAVLPNAQAGDEVLLRLESPGGVVHGYGLAASQLSRIKEAGVTLVIAVDKVAASGGYMMACVGDRIWPRRLLSWVPLVSLRRCLIFIDC